MMDKNDNVVIRRRGGQNAALIAVSELSGLLETACLLRSPANARRLLAALSRALKNGSQPMTIADLPREVEPDE